ncbi:flagellar basal body protein, partial [Rhizobium ruizarguesonis]
MRRRPAFRPVHRQCLELTDRQSGLYVSLSSQMALEKRLNTSADNMANVNTTGFRATEVKFDERV